MDERCPEVARCRVLEVFEVHLAIEHIFDEPVELVEGEGKGRDDNQGGHPWQCRTCFKLVLKGSDATSSLRLVSLYNDWRADDLSFVVNDFGRLLNWFRFGHGRCLSCGCFLHLSSFDYVFDE